MTESTKALMALKKAANYSKLTFHKFGPRSYKKGQGALLKVVYKFGEGEPLKKKRLEKILGWRGKELRRIAYKAKKNGYVEISDPKYGFAVSLTDKGRKVVEKRIASDDKCADMILEALSPEEVEALVDSCNKISETCKGLGIDYGRIAKKPRKLKKKCSGACKRGACDCVRQRGVKDKRREAPKFVFVFEDEGSSCKGEQAHSCER
jgi:DNA-binding MarR family transcriptional regulator